MEVVQNLNSNATHHSISGTVLFTRLFLGLFLFLALFSSFSQQRRCACTVPRLVATLARGAYRTAVCHLAVQWWYRTSGGTIFSISGFTETERELTIGLSSIHTSNP